jgi:hypothetical protein
MNWVSTRREPSYRRCTCDCSTPRVSCSFCVAMAAVWRTGLSTPSTTDGPTTTRSWLTIVFTSSAVTRSKAKRNCAPMCAWLGLASHRNKQTNTVIYGRSLASGLATGRDMTVLVSANTIMAALAAEHFPWVPQAVLRCPMRTHVLLSQIRNPLLLIHGLQDSSIAPAHKPIVQLLFLSAKAPWPKSACAVTRRICWGASTCAGGYLPCVVGAIGAMIPPASKQRARKWDADFASGPHTLTGFCMRRSLYSRNDALRAQS